MTEQDAQKLGSFVLDAGLDASILTIEDGRAFCVRIQQPQWHCFCWEDWDQFCKEAKKRRKQQRARDERPAIDARSSYTLRMPAMV